jgi:hypothetical protein
MVTASRNGNLPGTRVKINHDSGRVAPASVTEAESKVKLSIPIAEPQDLLTEVNMSWKSRMSVETGLAVRDIIDGIVSDE